MNRTLVIGDIHGALKALQEVLLKAKVKSKDELIFLGDYVDGWRDSANVIDFLIQLSHKQSCIFIKGNHDDLLLNWLNTNQTNETWLLHGGKNTVECYQKINTKKKNLHANFIHQMRPYHIDSQNRLFVHAGFANLRGPKHEHYPNTVYWDRTLWELALATDPRLTKDNDRYPKRLQLFSEIYIGHTPTSRYNSHTPMIAQNVYNLDTAAAYKGPLTIYDIHSKEYWQSTPVYKLYPDQKGRN